MEAGTVAPAPKTPRLGPVLRRSAPLVAAGAIGAGLAVGIGAAAGLGGSTTIVPPRSAATASGTPTAAVLAPAGDLSTQEI